jgi:hypothetical protein
MSKAICSKQRAVPAVYEGGAIVLIAWSTGRKHQSQPPMLNLHSAQRQLPKLDVAGSNPVSRSIFSITYMEFQH